MRAAAGWFDAMYSVRVCTTDDRDLPVPDLGVGLSWDRITEVLRREVSSDAAELLAEPIADPARGQTHWHIATTDDPLPLSALSGAERERLLRVLDERRRAVLDFADFMAALGGEAELRLAAALRTVVETPDPERHVWSAAGRPVLTAWGRRSRDQQTRLATIIASAPKPPAPPARPASAFIETMIAARDAARREPAAQGTGRVGAAAVARPSAQSWLPALLSALLWALLALLVLAIFYLLLPACAVNLPLLRGALNRCPAQAGAALTALQERNLALRETLHAAETKAALREGECAPPRRAERTSPPGPVEKAPDARETEDRSRRAKGTEGVLDVTLAWNGREDLDLYVMCPDGQIWASSRNACGGTLEIDRNRQADAREDNPVEHVTWTSAPPPGEYRVLIVLYNRFDLPARDVPFTVVIKDGDERRVFKGVVKEVKVPVPVAEFQR
jgi:hypothetical protein